MQFAFPRVTIIAGHYGSGKTNLAVNLALQLAKPGQAFSLCDLDIVNPYFRTADFAEKLAQLGVELIAPASANTNLDLPAITPRLAAALQEPGRRVLIDLGGDDAGAFALGRYAPTLRELGDWAMLYVINASRPLTATPEQAVEILREIEQASRLSATGIINNTHLASLTDVALVQASAEYAQQVCRLTGLPLAFTAAEKSIAAQLQKEQKPLGVEILVKTPWEDSP